MHSFLERSIACVCMPFNSTIGSTFNCGFYRTVVYEYLGEKREDMQKSKDPQMARYVFLSTSWPCFVVLSLRWVMDILTRVSLQGSLKCERLCDKVQKAFSRFCTVNCKEKYLKTFSSVKWKTLPPSKKAAHSLSSCVACASQFADLQIMKVRMSVCKTCVLNVISPLTNTARACSQPGVLIPSASQTN